MHLTLLTLNTFIGTAYIYNNDREVYIMKSTSHQNTIVSQLTQLASQLIN